MKRAVSIDYTIGNEVYEVRRGSQETQYTVTRMGFDTPLGVIRTIHVLGKRKFCALNRGREVLCRRPILKAAVEHLVASQRPSMGGEA